MLVVRMKDVDAGERRIEIFQISANLYLFQDFRYQFNANEK